MKIVCIEELKQGYNIHIKPDTAVHNNEQPFYIPEFDSELGVEVGIVLKISKMGKCISEKFANNYYEEISLGIQFVGLNTKKYLQEKGFFLDRCHSFDGSFVIGDWQNKNEAGYDYEFFKKEKLIKKYKINCHKINEILCYVSNYFTLRKGDLLFFSNVTEEVLTEENTIIGKMFNNQILFINIK